jgi:uncharacterized protein (TIGR02246 family)
MRTHKYQVALVLWAGLGAAASAQDTAAIQSRNQAFIKALSAGNAAAVAEFWTSTGEYTRGGATIRGRDNILKAYAEHFKTKPTGQLVAEDSAIRFLSEGVAVQEGAFAVERENPADSLRSRFSALYVKVDGQWLFGLLREEPEGPSLAELDWLAGEWSFKTGDGQATMSVRRTKAGAFLLVQTTIQAGDDESVATQVIGVDPATGGLKSWTFESDGSIGTADWVRTETGWLANVASTNAGGEQVKAVTTLTPSTRDAFTFQSTERTVDGEPAPNIDPVQVTRTAAAPSTTGE